MELSRRRALRLACATGPLLAGCLAENDPDADDTGASGDDEDDGSDGGTSGPSQDDLPIVEEPPEPIEEPACSRDARRDPLWLCEGVATETSLEYEQVATRDALLASEGLARETRQQGHQVYAALLAGDDDRERLRSEEGTDLGDLVAGTDFDAQALLVVETGWGSGSITPHLARIEATDDGVHAAGCYRRACGGTGDYTARTLVARFERPETLEAASVQLTIEPELRVTVGAGDDVLTVSDD